MTEQLHKVFVGGLSPVTTQDTVATFFSQFGQLTDARVIMDKLTGNSKGYGFV
jgi:RNA-binding protein Musashi